MVVLMVVVLSVATVVGLPKSHKSVVKVNGSVIPLALGSSQVSDTTDWSASTSLSNNVRISL